MSAKKAVVKKEEIKRPPYSQVKKVKEMPKEKKQNKIMPFHQYGYYK